jgi:plastocyanin
MSETPAVTSSSDHGVGFATRRERTLRMKISLADMRLIFVISSAVLILAACGNPAHQGLISGETPSTSDATKRRVYRSEFDQFQTERPLDWERTWFEGRTQFHPSELPTLQQKGDTIAVEFDAPTHPTSQTDIIYVGDNRFTHERVVVTRGTTVTWKSYGSLPHTVVADDGSFDSHPECSLSENTTCLNEGETFQFRFDRLGQFPFYCRLHGAQGGVGMAGVVVVADWTPAGQEVTGGELNGRPYRRAEAMQGDGSRQITYFFELWPRAWLSWSSDPSPFAARIIASNARLWGQYGEEAQRLIQTLHHDPPPDTAGPVESEFGIVSDALLYDHATQNMVIFMFSRFEMIADGWLSREAETDYKTGELRNRLYTTGEAGYEIESRDGPTFVVRIDYKSADRNDAAGHRERIEVTDSFPGRVVRAEFAGYVRPRRQEPPGIPS